MAAQAKKVAVIEDAQRITPVGTEDGSCVKELTSEQVAANRQNFARVRFARNSKLQNADDTVFCFSWVREQTVFARALEERLGAFGLELRLEKTRRIELGRYAEQNRKQ